MTAEVGVLSRLGVSLAADSAVTLGPAGKIYTSADKLFQLSECAPVGAMVYGSANLVNMPWETVIKLYRRQLQERTFPTLEEYASDLLRYLRRNDRFFPATEQTGFVRGAAYSFLLHVRDTWLKEVKKRLSNAEANEAELLGVLRDVIDAEKRGFEGREPLDNLPSRFTATFRKTYRSDLNEICDKVFEQLPMNAAMKRRLTSTTVLALTRQRVLSSGLVIAGFGESEHFPRLVELQVDGVACGQPLCFRSRRILIDHEAAACVIPFAQGEMVATFMDGVDPDILSVINESTSRLFVQVAQVIKNHLEKQGEALGQRFDEEVVPEIAKMIDGLEDTWRGVIQKYYSGPVMNIVAALPKDELAAIAESLVNLTKFKRRVSTQQETVGGPIDVAVITKGDGFVWVKRKHYFPAELNRRFFNRGPGGSASE